MPYYYTDEVMAWMRDALRQRTDLGFQYVDYGDPDDFIPGTPAVIITNGPRARTLHATHQFRVSLSLELWVLHANASVGASERRIEDVQLCNAIQDFLDLNMNLPDIANMTVDDKMNNPEGNIVQGWISGESPGVIARKGALYVATRMTWDGLSIQPFV